jgi:hypothetical protein
MNIIARLTAFLSFLIMVQYANAAGNSVYVDQIGTGSAVSFTQTGSSNEIGNSTKAATINGNNNTISIEQIGDGNISKLDISGSGAVVTSSITGNNNTVDIDCGAASGTCSTSSIVNTISGDGNIVTQKSDNLFDSIVNILSNDNTVTINNTSTAVSGAKTVVDISGASDNSVSILQTGVAGVNGHDTALNIVGGLNIVDIKQGGTVDSKITSNITGSSNNLTIKSNVP